MIGRPAPASLSKVLMIRVLRWREQIARTGDLDPAALAVLARALGRGSTSSAPATSSSLRAGSILVREHGGILHRVMVLNQGYAWNGQTFASLSSVARAITGTNWNGRRFFGLDRKTPDPKAGLGDRARRPEGGSA